jgi:hypothetical protein
MKTVCLVWMSILAVSASVFAQEKPASTAVDGNIKWVFDLQEGQRLSRGSDQPLFIVFRCER